MKKILIFFFSFFFTINLNASDKKSQNFLGCDYSVNENRLINFEKIKIKNIEIDILNYRNWTVNNIKIVTSGTRFIGNEYKKKFKGNILVTYENGIKCLFTGKIRQSGDAKDHIALNGNSIVQSLDVSLDFGNIKGITKFKLFKPDVRGNLNDVILQTQILRNFGYLAPRSIKVNARINQSETVMLFQEKAAKELLEFNKRREGPILEGDQKFFFKLVKDIPDNNLSNWDVGTPNLRNKSVKVMLSKLTNANIINKGDIHKEISYLALNKLNLIYLYYANRFQDKKNNFYFFDYDLDNELLGLFNKDNIHRLNVYNLLMQSTNSHHALSVSNRKFFFNSIENFYEPINYDANPEIDLNNPTTTSIFYRQPLPRNMNEVFSTLETKLKKINVDKFYDQVSLSGISLSKDQTRKKIVKILENLKKIENNYKNTINQESILHNEFKPIGNILDKFNETLQEIDPNTYLVKHNLNNNNLERCKISLNDCQTYKFSNDQLSSLLEGELKIDNTNYQYLGKNLNLEELDKNLSNVKREELNKSIIFYENGIEVTNDSKNKRLIIDQKIPGSKAYLMGGELENLSIIFNGFKIKEDNNSDIVTFPKNFPINNKGLTGCLSFVNINLKENIDIKFTNSTCEDAVNFLNAKGNIDNIIINKSFSDGLDVDFSELYFKSIIVTSALNDCADFSAGTYKIEILDLKFCGDKGLSIGEKSIINLNEISVEKSNIGIAAKDSSILKLNLANLNNLKTCLAAYNKKQEYEGAIIKLKKMKCKNFYEKAVVDGMSKIFLADVPLNNFNFGKKYNSLKLTITKLGNNNTNKNFIKDYKTFNKDKTFNSVIEISSGMKEKWEVSKTNGLLEREFYMGTPREIKFSPYPVNYGMIPRTILPISKGGDGGPLDVFILGESMTQGDVVKAKAIGVLRMTDTGKKDDKIIAVHSKSKFYKFNNIDHLNSEHPELVKKIVFWFENYKGKNVVEFIKFGSANEANNLIKSSEKLFKRSGVKPRS